MVLNGNHYDEICRKFQKEFEFVFGSHWRDMLDIPPKPSRVDTNYIIPPGTYTADWVYHLMLADDGKIDDWVIFEGFPAGGINTAYRNMKFVQCIENRLVSKGVEGVKFVFKPCDSKRTVSTCSPQSIARTIAGGHFIIEATAFDVSDTIRLW